MRWLLAFLLLLGVTSRAMAEPVPLKVGYAGAAPFVVDAGGTPTGLSLEIWKSAARELGVHYRLVGYDRLDQALIAVESGEIDLLVGPLTITAERSQNMSFSMPYFRSSLGIVGSTRTESVLERLKPLLSKAVAMAFGALLLALLGVGTLLWLVERRAEGTQFRQDPFRGIPEGMWLALTTMSTVGYGDLCPITIPGRLICGAWMLVSLVTTSLVTAAMATTFTVTQMNSGPVTSADAMAGRKVAVVRGSEGAEFALEHRAMTVLVDHLDEALARVQDGRAAAAVYDRPILQYWVQQHPEAGMVVASTSYDPQDYGFAVPLGSRLLHPLNVALLKLNEEGQMARLQSQWLGR